MRKQVAQRLGKSVATVRRLEGVLLHPTVDSTGKHRFDSDEVEQLAGGIQRGEIALWHQMRGASEPLRGNPMNGPDSDGCAGCAEREQELAQMRDKLAEQERRSRREVDALRAERDRERAVYKAEQRELERELRRFIDDVVNG